MRIKRKIDQLEDLILADQPAAARRLLGRVESRLKQIQGQLPRVREQHEALGDGGPGGGGDPAIDPKARWAVRWLNISIPVLLLLSTLVAGFLWNRTIAPAPEKAAALPAAEASTWMQHIKDFFE